MSKKVQSGVGFSSLPVSEEAGAQAATEAMKRSGTEKPELAILFSTAKHDPVRLLASVRAALGPQARVIGGSAAGIITNDHLSYNGSEVGVAVLSSDSIRADLFLEAGLGTGDEVGVGKRLARQIRSRDFASEPNLFLMYDSVRGSPDCLLNMATPLLNGMQSEFASWPRTAGVGMIGDMAFSPTYQYFEDRVTRQSAVGFVLHGDVRMDTTIIHGCRPSSDYQTITKTDGPVVLEINGLPAIEAISKLLGPDSEKSWEDFPLFITLGVNKGGRLDPFREENYANRLVMALDKKRGGLVMFEPDLKPGMSVQLMRRSIDTEYIGQRVAAARRQCEGREIFLALYVDCAGRASAYCDSEVEEASSVQRALGDIPLLGMYSGVEIAKVGQNIQPLDWTGVLCFFSR